MKRGTIRGWLVSHARRTTVELANVLLNHDAVFRAIGQVNRRIGVIESVFLVYPAGEHYALAYAYPRRVHRSRWMPWPVGLLVQNGKATLMFGVSSHNEHFHDEANHDNLASLVDRMERLRVMTGARQKTFAGVLPGVLAAHGILNDPPEGDITAGIVAQAVRRLQAAHDAAPPVIILGARGYIGRRLADQLAGAVDLHPVDVADPNSHWPSHLQGQPAILVNVANRHALPQNLDQLWSGMTILNEVYPEPDRQTLATLTARGIAVHHVVGVRGSAYPPFPAAYAGGVPCCAAWPSPDAEVVIRHLNPVPVG